MAIKVKKDGRIVRTGKDYTEFRATRWLVQRGRCKNCDRLTSLEVDIDSDWSFHVHHVEGRGLGGGKRDDALGSVEGLCGRCHRQTHELLNKGVVEKEESGNA